MSPRGPARGPDWLKDVQAARRKAVQRRPAKTRASRVLGHVADAEYLGGTTIRFTYRGCGHVETKDYGKGPKPKRMGPDGCRFMAGWWSRSNGGVTSACPACERARRRTERDAGGGRP